MNKILYDDGSLIILRELNSWTSVVWTNVVLAIGTQKSYQAQAIYIKKDDVLFPVKYISPQIMNEFCEKHNINMHLTGRFEKKGYPARMFYTAKDQFLFELKFGT